MSSAPPTLAERALHHQQAGEAAQAEAIWRHLALTEPENTLARFYLGTLLGTQDRLDEAEAWLAEAAASAPNSAEILGNLGLIRQRRGRLEEALRDYQRAVALRPDLPMLRNNLAVALQELGWAEESFDLCRALDIEVADSAIGANLLSTLNLVPGTPADAFAAARHWAARFAEPLTPPPHPVSDDASERPLRVGYFGAEGFRRHSLAMTWLPLLEAHDRRNLDVFVYSDLAATAEDDVSRRFQTSATWRRTRGLGDQSFADAVRADRIDILVDANGFAAGSRLLALARRPAPVQIHFPTMSTTGMTAIDYAIGDARLFPPDLDAYFSEKLWRLPHAYLYAPLDALPPLGQPPALQKGYVTFGSFNRMAKIGRESAAAWAGALRAVPGSRLIVKSGSGVPAAASARLLERFATYGVAAERIEFRGRTPSDAAHFLHFNDVDIALDTTPHCGVTTTFDALAMGVPVISLVGARPLERYGAAILGALGFDEGLAGSVEEFSARATALALDLDRLASLRGTLRSRLFASSLCDAAGFARALEAAYRAMWRARCGQPDRLDARQRFS